MSITLEEKSVLSLTIESDIAFDWSSAVSPEKRFFQEVQRNRMSSHMRSLKRFNASWKKGKSLDQTIAATQNRSTVLLIRSRMNNLAGKARLLQGAKFTKEPCPSNIEPEASDIPKARKSVLERSVLENRSLQIERYSKQLRPTIRLKKKPEPEREGSLVLPKLGKGLQLLGHSSSPRQILALRKGVLLVRRRHLRPITSRSPLMLAIAHWANFVDLALLYEFMFKFYDQKATFSSYYTSITLTCHYLYYFPYLLRCYRLRFVFKLDKNWESTYFRDNIKRAKQRWQLLALGLLMIPVLIVAAFLAVLPEQNVFIPESVQSDSSNERTELVYIFVCFLEQVLFITAVFQLRHISDDYKMTLELTIVCCLWLCNSAFSKYSASSWWLYECVARNWAMMLVSSLWPVLKSFRKSSFQEMITPEVANSLELALQNEFTLDCFESYLCCCEWLAEEKQCLPPDDILRFWLQCEILRTDQSPDLADSIRRKYAKFLLYAAEEPSSAGPLAEKLGREESPFPLAQRVAFARLKEYFSLFQRSLIYSKMMREVTRQEIYANRLFMTSMHGADK